MIIKTSELKPGDLIINKLTHRIEFLIIAVYDIAVEQYFLLPFYSVAYNPLGTTKILYARTLADLDWEIDNRC